MTVTRAFKEYDPTLIHVINLDALWVVKLFPAFSGAHSNTPPDPSASPCQALSRWCKPGASSSCRANRVKRSLDFRGLMHQTPAFRRSFRVTRTPSPITHRVPSTTKCPSLPQPTSAVVRRSSPAPGGRATAIAAEPHRPTAGLRRLPPLSAVPSGSRRGARAGGASRTSLPGPRRPGPRRFATPMASRSRSVREAKTTPFTAWYLSRSATSNGHIATCPAH